MTAEGQVLIDPSRTRDLFSFEKGFGLFKLREKLEKMLPHWLMEAPFCLME